MNKALLWVSHISEIFDDITNFLFCVWEVEHRKKISLKDSGDAYGLFILPHLDYCNAALRDVLGLTLVNNVKKLELIGLQVQLLNFFNWDNKPFGNLRQRAEGLAQW